MIELRVIDRLKPLNQKAMYDHPSGWKINVGDYFQPNSTNVSGNNVNITDVNALLPPISPYEEPTKRGDGQNITFMLLICGILVPIDSEGEAGNIQIFDWLMMTKTSCLCW